MESIKTRRLNCELGILSRCDGSAFLSLGDTTTLVAVYGPCEVKPQNLMIDKAFVQVLYKPKMGLSGIADKLEETTIENISASAILTSQHPRTSISIIVQEMQDSGGLLATCINATCLALMNAGIPMKYLFAAVSCMINKDDQIIFDPHDQQLKMAKSVFTIVFDSVDKNVVATETCGKFNNNQFERVLIMCKQASSIIFEFYRETLKKYSSNLS